MSLDMALTTELRLLTIAPSSSRSLNSQIRAVIKVRRLTRAVGYPTGRSADLPAWAQRRWASANASRQARPMPR
jgi:hypothetical protein